MHAFILAFKKVLVVKKIKTTSNMNYGRSNILIEQYVIPKKITAMQL